MAKYGKTFWGKEWLNALKNIDYGNRLPRGSSYASKGAVKSVEVKHNHIEAKVQGSRPKNLIKYTSQFLNSAWASKPS